MAKPNKPTLRIAKLPNLTPVKMTVSLEQRFIKCWKTTPRFTEIAMARQLNPPNSCRL